jgi:chromosome segregation ATPase
MLTAASPIPGVHDKIAALRQRYAQVAASVQYYEERLAEQQVQLEKLNRSREDYMDEADETQVEPEPVAPLTEEDLRREEEEMRQLEKKKKELEDRVHSMSRDISGLR